MQNCQQSDNREYSIVKGRIATGERIQLSVLDLLIGHLNMAGVYFFQRVPDLPRLKRALAETLDLFPSFGASIIRHNDGFYLYQNNVGIGFTLVHSADRSTDAQYAGPIMEGNPLIDDGLPFEYEVDSGLPILHLRLTVFADQGCALTLRFIHSLTDGAGMSRFLQTWSALYRGLEPPAPGYQRRDVITRLAVGEGSAPSKKFDLRPTSDWPVTDRIEVDPADFGIRYVDIDQHLLDTAIKNCRANASLPLSSSDVIHALAWQAFARSVDIEPNQTSRLHTIFDIRAVAELHIPASFEGNALFERGATIAFGALRKLPLHELAELYHRQVKPLAADDIRQDIAFLERELTDGHVEPKSGRFSRFLRASMVECMAPSALFINDMRLLKSAEVAFEDCTHRYETAISLGRNFVFVYSRGDNTTFLYTGHKSTTQRFADELLGLVAHCHLDAAEAIGQ
jgi:hypothetical protein